MSKSPSPVVSEWVVGIDQWPDWGDAGRVTEMELEDGTVIRGVLSVGDFFSTDDGDEVPCFQVETGPGASFSLTEAKRWRYLT